MNLIVYELCLKLLNYFRIFSHLKCSDTLKNSDNTKTHIGHQ